MTTKTIFRIAVNFAMLAAMFVAITALYERGIGMYVGWDDVGRLNPFSNAHLSEELSLGTYSPLVDWIFLSYTVALSLPFAVSGYSAGTLRPPMSSIVAYSPTILAVALYVWVGMPMLAGVTDLHMLVAFGLQIGCFLIGSGLGIFIGRRKTRAT
jgi:hypothetical protein